MEKQQILYDYNAPLPSEDTKEKRVPRETNTQLDRFSKRRRRLHSKMRILSKKQIKEKN